ncbi:DUF5134 domain-containing protein [Actinomadura sp. LD22]|uniref:DUF5134 domain-containing protein n=1 Tax=Actinomadura physcomitrii TaxID=2650748 RepID=A0A6I4MI65_9ACTN|nr:DUF5134 domain-containing protein [Actinomadura physcomitrii]MWA05858.1 DUF5134 domain-containing protein [Actinomadura physcomitrii]
MIAATGLRWVLTILFAVLALYGTWRAITGHGGRHAGQGEVTGRVAHALHAAMAVAMGAMVWPRGMDLPARPQVVFFTVAALWFVAVAVVIPGGVPRVRALPAALPHVLVMGAMAWMVHAMTGAMSGHGGSGGMGDMAGMDMSGGSGLSSMSVHGGARAAAAVLAVLMLAFTLRWLARAFDIARADGAAAEGPAGEQAGDEGAWDLGCHGAMAFGMAVMLALLL